MHKGPAFAFSLLKHAEHVSFFNNFLLALDKAGSILGLNSELYAAFTKAVGIEQDIVNRSQASAYTPEMEDLDKKRDLIFRRIRLHLQSLLCVSVDSPVKPYVNTIQKYLVDKYAADVTQAAYQEEIAHLCGYTETRSLTRYMERTLHMSPYEYRNGCHREQIRRYRRSHPN